MCVVLPSLLASLCPMILKQPYRQSQEFLISKMSLNHPAPPLKFVLRSSAPKVLRLSELQSLHFRAPIIRAMVPAHPARVGGNARTAPLRPSPDPALAGRPECPWSKMQTLEL